MRIIRLLFSAFCLFCFFTSDLSAQDNDAKYLSQWRRVESFAEKKRFASAFQSAKEIYELARKEGEAVQAIKALLYMGSLYSENQLRNNLFVIQEIEKELINSQEPVRSVLNSLLAELYLQYFYQVRWNLYSRSNTINYKSYDIDTWSADDFHTRVKELILASLQNEKLLQSIPTSQFDAIITRGNARIMRPTLYDLLAHRAVDYFISDESEIRKFVPGSIPDTILTLVTAEEFTKYFNGIPDSIQQPALKIFNKLLTFHQQDENPAALIDADIKRVQFIKNRSSHKNISEWYYSALKHIAEKYEMHPAAAQAWYLMAAIHEQNAAKWQPFGDTSYRYEKIKAEEICKKILLQEKESEGRTNCENLLNRIKLRQLDFSMEDVNIPGKPFRVFVKYTNTPVIWLRIAPYKESLEKIRTVEEYHKAISELEPVREWQQNLLSTEDMQQHGSEIKIDGLPPGKYMLIAATGKNFKQETVTTHLFYVSGISYIKKGNDMFILDRDNGQPLANAEIQVWERGYKRDLFVNEKGYTFQADSNGHFKLKLKLEGDKTAYGFIALYDIKHKDDRLFIIEDPERSYYSRYRYRYPVRQTNNNEVKLFLFTDRAIYRPAQAVYFKGIALLKDSTGRSGSVQQDQSFTLFLQNAGRQIIDSIKVTTNEYGSFSGQFQLPATGLTGDFQIHTGNYSSAANFQVEEYKRPKFYVGYDPVKGTYRLDDSVSVTGSAKAYAGNNIDGAFVKFRVVRHVRYLYDWHFWYHPRPWSTDEEIIHGETKTDDNGRFNITFKAVPDKKIDKTLNPVFDYSVYADVTDLNGETRSAESQVSVSYNALILSSDLPDKMPADSLSDLKIRTQNMSGSFDPAVVKVVITKLKNENRLIRKRMWERSDQFTLTKEDYIRYFPNDEYDNETEIRSGRPETIILQQTDSSRENGKWLSKNLSGKVVPGFYMISMETKDKYGEEVKQLKFIEVYNSKSNQLSHPDYLYTEAPGEIKPGETTSAILGTSAENVYIIQQISKGTLYLKPDTQAFHYFQLNNEKKKLNYTATETDQGGYGLEWAFVKHNRFYQHAEVINVPWTNKELDIEYLSFRDKTQPGSEENWKLRITGYKNEKVAAEVLASMYDASLDQLYPHGWYKPNPWNTYYPRGNWESGENFTKSDASPIIGPVPVVHSFEKIFDRLMTGYTPARIKNKNRNGRDTEPLWWINPLDYYYSETRNPRLMRLPKPVLPDSDGDGVTDQFDMEQTPPGCPVDQRGAQLDSDGDGIPDCKDRDNNLAQTDEPKVRTNFNETAFFFPNLTTDSTGAVEFHFTIPESLTQWKLQTLAHTKDLAFGYSQKKMVTQKQLMVQPNAPRFVREKDKIVFSSKIVNLSEKQLKGEAVLQLIDKETEKPVDSLFKNKVPKLSFTILPGKSIAVKFPIEIPQSFDKVLTWRIVAKASADPGEYFSDGEENTLPVLPFSILVTETMPLSVRGTATKKYTFDKLLAAEKSPTLKNHSLTVEYTSNPAWSAIQSLPYLMEYPYECAEQTWNRCYANALAASVVRSSPRIKEIVDKWNTETPETLLSNLEKNQELKSVLLEETPWVLQPKKENEQRKRLALLFDLVRMDKEFDKAIDKLQQLQTTNGGFVWFKGGGDDRYITQYILSGIGHLRKINALPDKQKDKLDKIVTNALDYLDKKIKEEYKELKKDKKAIADYEPGYIDIQYLYMRSFFTDKSMTNGEDQALNFLTERVGKTWMNKNKFLQGMVALALFRKGDKNITADILTSLKERAVKDDERGMYWEENIPGWYWYEAPIETQALLIEAFQEAGKDTKTVDDLRTWLLKNKQTNNWKTTKATAEACYALLLQGTEWLSNEPVVEIKLGSTTIKSTDAGQEAGTGYFKKTIEGTKVQPQMGNISVTVSSPNANVSASWGGVYWQYFEDLDKITTAATPLKLSKKLFVEKNTDRGPVITPINDGDAIKIGDKVKVRVELRVDRDMEYVHMKDMRASALEPVNVLSSYKWQGGLGYYESTKDASTNFFFSYLRKGTYVFEYSLFATHAGNFSNGITTIQCMYAPEFTSHSEGVRINVE